MSQLTDNLNRIASIKSDIKDAIEAKGVDMTGVSFPDYPEKIGEIQAGGGDLTQQDVTEKNFTWSVINNRASFVASLIYFHNSYIQKVNLPECSIVLESAFTSCDNLSEVSLPVCKTIHRYAFADCFSLTSVYAPECVSIYESAFQRCSIEYVYFPNCTSIGYSAFTSCYNISYVSLPKCSIISEAVFANCSSLEDISLPACEIVQSRAFMSTGLSSVYLPSCKTVYSSAFSGCSSLISVDLPVCSFIGNYAFGWCYSLTDVVVPLVQTISSYAFYSCSSLSEISLPVCSIISALAFSGCLLLSQMTIGTDTYIIASYGNNCLSGTPLVNGVGSIYVPACNYDRYVVANGWSSISARIVSVGDPTDYFLSYDNGLVYGRTNYLGNIFFSDIGVSNTSVISINLPDCGTIQIGGPYTYISPFRNCPNIKTVDLGAYNVNSFMFSGMRSLEYVNLPSCTNVSSGGFMYCSSLKTVNIPQCSYIGSSAFYGCSSLKSIDLPLCTDVLQYAFYACSSLSYVNLPVCSYIGYNAFAFCNSLSTIDLPVCSYIGDRGFGSCYSLSTIILKYDGVCEISSMTFYADNNLTTIYVPESLVSDYKVAQYWSSMSNKILAILPDLSFRDGLVYGWASSLNSGYLNELGISAGDVTGVSMSKLTSVASSTFMNHQNLVSVDIHLVGEYPDDMFNGTGFSEFDINVSALGDRVFANCSGLEKVTIGYDGIVTAGSNLFQNCPNLSQIGVPYDYYSDYLTAPGWSEYSSLMYQEVPLLAFSNGLVFGRTTTIDSTFLQTLGITSNQVVSVSLPNCVAVGKSTFLECHSLKDVYLPNCEYLSNGAFYGANYMNGIDLPKCSFIGDYAFYWCNYSMSYIKLGYSGVCTLEGGNALNQTTAMRSIYVPASLVSDYKVAPRWSNYSTRILPIPE